MPPRSKGRSESSAADAPVSVVAILLFAASALLLLLISISTLVTVLAALAALSICPVLWRSALPDASGQRLLKRWLECSCAIRLMLARQPAFRSDWKTARELISATGRSALARGPP